MSVLEQMRSGTDSTFMQVVMALVVVSFVGWYALPSGDKSSVVASVNGEKIMDTVFSRAYRNELRAVESRSGRTLGDEEQKQLQERVRQQLIEDEVVLQEAHRLGLEVSDTEVARQLLELDFLRNEDNKFDNELYTRFLKRSQFTRADFEQRLREDLLRNKARGLVFMGATISEPALIDAFVEAETRIDLEYVRVRASVFNDDVVITDEERASWLTTNEQRVVDTYQRDFDRLYNHPETVRLRMIRLAGGEGVEVADLLPRINKIRDEAEAGADFAALARRWSEDPSAVDGGDLGLRPMPQLASDVGSAVRDVPVGGLSRAMTSDTDVRLYRVEERQAPRVEAIDTVRNDIADRLIREERVPGLAASFAEEQLLPKWKELGTVPTDLLQSKGLISATTGPIPARADGGPFSPPEPMIKAARTAKPGEVFDRVFEGNGVLWVGQLRDRVDADMKLFEAQRDTIRDQVLMERRIAFYQAWVADAKAAARIE